MCKEIDWSKPIRDAKTKEPATYVRDRRDGPDAERYGAKIPEMGDVNAGGLHNYPFVVRLKDRYETFCAEGYTCPSVSHEEHGTGFKIENVPGLDFSKPMQTKSGRLVRILCTDAPGDYPVVGYFEKISDPGPFSSVGTCTWTLEGIYNLNFKDCDDNLEQRPPPTRRVWFNLYKNGPGAYFETEEAARRVAPQYGESVTMSADVPA